MTTLAFELSCMFCGRPARRRQTPGDVPAHDFDCVCCGRYRVGETAEARMRGNGMSLYADVLPKITGANNAGYRLVLPSCFIVPLADERVVAIVAQADTPVEQPPAARSASRSVLGDYRRIAASR
jgi:hypothetical protein